MSKVYHKLFVHCVWEPYLRQPLITPKIKAILKTFFENKALRFGCRVHAVGGIENHIHVVLQLSPARSVSDIVGKLKGSSTYFLNNELGITKDFYWQDGYGAETFAERDLDKIIRYVENQEVHHRTGNLDNRLEYIPDPDAPDDNDDDT